MRSGPSKQQWENNLNLAKLESLNRRSSIKVRDYIPIIFWHACESETCPNILGKVIITFKYIVRWGKLYKLYQDTTIDLRSTTLLHEIFDFSPVRSE